MGAITLTALQARRFLNRNDLALLLDLSVPQIAANERSLGLLPIRLNARVVRYSSKAALSALKSRNMLPLDVVPDTPQAPSPVGKVIPLRHTAPRKRQERS
jgi:hypothetical protein